MSDFNRGFVRPAPAQADMSVDAGLRSFMLGVYNKVALGLVVSGALAWLTSHAPLVNYIFPTVQTPYGLSHTVSAIGMVLMFAPLVVILGSRFLMRSATPQNSGILYWTIVSLIGASMGVLLLRYTGTSIATTFFVTAAGFGGLSLFGYTTKRDLSAMGSFLIMGLIGIVIASIVNVFLHSSVVAFTVSLLGVLIFAGLIAWDTQRLKMTYYQVGGDQAAMSVATNFGALSLYLDFINLFQFLLSFMGSRR
ncbi:Bax inhibitor-1/YccA family protein [Caulobacter sp. S45]|uniref:Bax inhibitor-1/YccA family protein n=1 Tax=Caulobacter sp. S45 TaxID=1641861 RepID=UPI00131CC677|nr:Bax inhibitor-1/YccA family protein [Caulobacter sp. S45]